VLNPLTPPPGEAGARRAGEVYEVRTRERCTRRFYQVAESACRECCLLTYLLTYLLEAVTGACRRTAARGQHDVDQQTIKHRKINVLRVQCSADRAIVGDENA